MKSEHAGQRERILLFIPMYNCEKQIGRVLQQISLDVEAVIAEIIVVDNRSSDSSIEAAIGASESIKIPFRIFRNDSNYGLGGSHKVAFQYALANSFDYVIILHGDDQGDVSDVLPHIAAGSHRHCDALLGARFMNGSRLSGYSKMRTAGNIFFNALYSLVVRKSISDLGSGLNVYSVKKLADRWWLKNADDLTFNYHMLLRSYNYGWRVQYFPLVWREDDQVSNVKLIRQASRVLSIPLFYAFSQRKYMGSDYSNPDVLSYTSTEVFCREQ